MQIKCGMIVKSVAGHDKGRFYVVVEIKNNRAFIADGKKRLLKCLKAKNFVHLKVTNSFVEVEKLNSDRKLRNILHSYNYNADVLGGENGKR